MRIYPFGHSCFYVNLTNLNVLDESLVLKSNTPEMII